MPSGEYAHAVGDALLELVGELVGLLRAAGGVVEEGDLGHEQAIFARNGNAVFSFRGIEDAGERTAHSWSWVSRSMPRLCHISRLSAMFDSPFVRRRHPAPGAMRTCALRVRFPITITRRIANP